MAIDLLNVSNSLGSLKLTLIGSMDGRQDNSIEAFKRITFVQTMPPDYKSREMVETGKRKI
jgi:hypothetical protein